MLRLGSTFKQQKQIILIKSNINPVTWQLHIVVNSWRHLKKVQQYSKIIKG